VPIIATSSPSGALLCSLLSSSEFSKIVLHTAPRRDIAASFIVGTGNTNHSSVPSDASRLALALHSRTSIADVVYSLSLPTTSLTEVEATLNTTLTLLEQWNINERDPWTNGPCALLLETYKYTSVLNSTKILLISH